MKFFGVAGSPVLHSKSPIIFRHFFKNSSTEAAYSRVAADSASEVVFIFNSFGFDGMNITSPFKSEIIPCLAALDQAASLTGSANTIIRQGDGIAGYNTDHAGAVKPLEKRGVHLAGKKCVVIGAGGAGAAAAFGLLKKGAEVTVVNRTYEKAQKTAFSLGCRAVELEFLRENLNDAHILVSAIPSGTEFIHKNWLKKGLFVFDANYKKPALLEMAEAAGCHTIKGEEWLYHQALGAWTLFSGQPVNEVEIDLSALDSACSERKKSNISLIGFMGCGKSSVGRTLAAKMGLNFFDSDEEIEKDEGMEIQGIFEKKGEAYFRGKEGLKVERLKEMKKTVFSCGGGAVADANNRQILRDYSLVIYVFSTLKTCLERAAGNKRPLLKSAHSPEITEKLYRKRKEIYFCAADLLVNGEKKKEEVANKIYDEISQAYGN